MSDEPVPHVPLVERAMLAAVCMEPSAIQYAADLGPTAFYSERHRAIFLAACKVFAKRRAVDLAQVHLELVESGQLAVAGGIEYLAGLTDPSIYTFQHGQHYAAILKEYERKRQGVVAAQELDAIARAGDADAILSALRNAVRRIEEYHHADGVKRISLREIVDAEIPTVTWIVEDWISSASSFVIGGEWGAGKSYLAVDLAISLAAGIPWLGHMRIPKAVPVVYFDEENPEEIAKRRLLRLMNGRNLDPATQKELPLGYLHANRIKLNTPKGRNLVAKEILSWGARVIILDSIVRFARGVKSTDGDALAAFHDDAITPLKAEYGIAVVGLDHMRKPSEHDDKADPAHRITGSQEKSAYADSVATFYRDRSTKTGELRASKVRGLDARLPVPVSTAFEESADDRSCWIQGRSATINAELTIMQTLDAAGGSLRARQIYEGAVSRGASLSTTKRELERLVDSGLILRNAEDGRRAVTYRRAGLL